MAKKSKRQRLAAEKVDKGRDYPVLEAIDLLNTLAKGAKFKESVDIAVNLGVDSRRADQNVRGSTTLPFSTGKEIRVAVFADGENADKAREAGADVVGLDDLADSIKGGEVNFDVVLATPDSMRVVGSLGRILGPRGLMPNPRSGTVTADVEVAVKEREIRTGAVSSRPQRDHSWQRWTSRSECGRSQEQCRSAGERSEAGKTSCIERYVSAEDHVVDNYGTRHLRRCRLSGGMSQLESRVPELNEEVSCR